MPNSGFRFRWYVYVTAAPIIILSLLAAVLASLRTDNSHESAAYQQGAVAGALFTGLLCPVVAVLLVGTLTYFISKRSTNALNRSAIITLILLGLLLGMSLLGNLAHLAGLTGPR